MSAMMGYHHHLLPYLPALAEIWKREAGNGHPASVLLRRQSRDGEWRWVRVRASRNSWCSRLALTSGGRINRGGGESGGEQGWRGAIPWCGAHLISSRVVARPARRRRWCLRPALAPPWRPSPRCAACARLGLPATVMRARWRQTAGYQRW
jgi:hypothetical protein